MSDSTVSRRQALFGTAAIAAVATLPADEADAAQRNMHAAVEHLKNARAALERAQANKGGHRRRAISLIDEAIQETRLGIRYAAPRG